MYVTTVGFETKVGHVIIVCLSQL